MAGPRNRGRRMDWFNRPRKDFGALRAIVEGDGAPVLLLHGVRLRSEAWNSQTRWLSHFFAATAPDMPGHGESVPFETVDGLGSYTDRVAEAMDGPAVVIGHSMGALIALDLAICYSHLVLGVVALNGVFNRTQSAWDAIRHRADGLNPNGVNDPTPTLRRWFGGRHATQAQARRTWLTGVNPAGYKTAYSTFATENSPSRTGLVGMRCPALFATGANEPKSLPSMSEAMAVLAPTVAL